MPTKNDETQIKSRAWRLSHLYHILNKDKKDVIFVPNTAQQVILEYKRKQVKAKKPIRFICLKARQLGITTEEVIYKLDKCLFYDNQDLTITAHTMGKAQEIFRIIRYAYDKVPSHIGLSDGGVWYKPKPNYDSKSELYFRDHNSRIKVVQDTRSITPNDTHITELAHMENAEECMSAIDGSLSDSADIGIESTANGIGGKGGHFYSLWQANYGKNGPYTCFFFPWYLDDKYESSIPISQLGPECYIPKQKFHSKLENLLKDRYPPAQVERKISWYIQKCLTQPKITQEFPSTPEEAFLSSSRPILDLDYIALYQTSAENLSKMRAKDTSFDTLFFYHLDQNGKPIPEKDILIGVDVAEGVMNGDYSTIVGRRRKDKKLLFTYKGHIKPDLLAGVIDRIYKYGYQGMIGIERNNHGHATISACQYFYWFEDLYGEKSIDKRVNKETKKLGWRTSHASKAIMVTYLDSCIRDGSLPDMCEEEWKECYTFVYQEDGTMGAIAPEHDDLIIADAICLQMGKETFDTVS